MRRISSDDLIADLEQVSEMVDGPLTMDDYDKLGEYHHQTYISRFGTWSDAKAAIGETVAKPGRHAIPDEELLDDIKRIAKDGKVTSTDYIEDGSFSLPTIIRRFGSWTEARERAGIGKPAHKQTKHHRDDLDISSGSVFFCNKCERRVRFYVDKSDSGWYFVCGSCARRMTVKEFKDVYG